MTQQIEENINYPELREWMMPSFTTSTNTDTIITSILMMGALQPLFSFSCMTCRRIPSVTLLGERSDCQKLLAKLEKLQTFGTEPALFAELLRPVLSRFLRALITQLAKV